MSRRYTIEARRGGYAVMVAGHEDAPTAFASFITALAQAGHSEYELRLTHQRFTVAMMEGKDGVEVMDPDLNGSVSIHITSAP